MTRMRISQLAARSGVPATTLRFYESAGLLPAARTPAGYRVYGEDAVDRLAFIGAAKRLGLPLEEIGELLAVRRSGVCAEVKADLRPRIAARLDAAERRAAELAAFTAELRAALARLDGLPDRAEPCDPRCGLSGAPDAEPDAEPAGAPGAEPDALPAGVPDAGSVAEPDAGSVAERWRAAPVACSLGGQDLADRVAAWHRTLDGARRTSVPDGLRLTVPAARTVAVAELAAAEQRCCPFLDVRLLLDGPELHLEVRAPAEGAALLAELCHPTA